MARFGKEWSNGLHVPPFAASRQSVRTPSGRKTIISLAANYYPQSFQPENAPQFAYYAYGKDYHDAVKCRLSKIAEFMKANWDCECRCCVDTAPLRERYWAVKAGIGFIGKNNQLIIPHKGSYFFLGEILTTLHLPADKETNESHHCGNCRKCIDACPANALQDDFSAVDARRCLSCLTIELRGDLPDGTAERLGNKVYGCDECQKSLSPQSLRHSCPYRRIPPDGRILVAFFRQYGKHGHCRLSTHIPQIGCQKNKIHRLDAQFGSDQPPSRLSCRRQTAKLSRNTATPSPPTRAHLHKGEICSNRICFAELEKNIYLCMYGFQRGKNPAFCHCPVL